MNVEEYYRKKQRGIEKAQAEARTEATIQRIILIVVAALVLTYFYVIYLLIKGLLFGKSKLIRIFSLLGLIAIAIGTILLVRYKLKDGYAPEPPKAVSYQSNNSTNCDDVKEDQSAYESTGRNSEDVETGPMRTKMSLETPVIKNSAGEYDWQSMCQKEWPKSFSDIQRAFSVFGGFQLAQPPIDGLGLIRGYKELLVRQEDVPLQKKYRYFQKADLIFFHGALIKFTLKTHFPKKYSMASIAREYKALQNDVADNLKHLNKPDLGIGLEKDAAGVVVYGQPPSPGAHKIVGRIYVTANLQQDNDDGYTLTLSVDAYDGYSCNGLRKFIEAIIEKEAYEAGEELEGFDKKQQSSDDSTNAHQSSNQAHKSDERKAEDIETRPARTETPVPSPTISVPEAKEVSPNLPEESTDHQPQKVVQQSTKRKAEDTATPSTRTGASISPPIIPVSNRKESSSGQSPTVRTNKVVKITGFGNYKFGQKYLASRMTAEMWQDGGLAIKPVKINYRKFRTLELGYAIDGKQLCRLKICAEFPSNTNDDQLSDELMKVKGEIERQLGLEMTGSEDEANYEDEKYIVKLWHEPTTKTVYSTKHVGFRKQRIANTINIKCLYLLLEDKRLMPK